MPNLDFYLSSLDSSFNVSKANITAIDNQSDNKVIAKAVAQLYVDASSVRQVFKFATNSSDLTDTAAEDLYFFVDAEKFSKLPSTTSEFKVNNVAGSSTGLLYDVIGNAYVSGTKNSANDYNVDALNAIYSVDNKSLIKDLFRDLAHQMFKTQYGVDIFNNENNLNANTAASLKNMLVDPAVAGSSNIWTVLNDASGMNVSNTTSKNIGKVILDSIAFNEADRLKDLSGSTDIYVSTSSLNTSGNSAASGSGGRNTEMRQYCMPLLSGDKLHFHIECVFDATQNMVVKDSNMVINSRWYEIILNLK
jgi:hypothetical protein